MNQQDTQIFYTPRELADLLRVEQQSITRWLRQERIQGIRVGFEWRIPRDEYEKILREGIAPRARKK